MDTKLLAHVSGELIAFAGMAVYFQRKSSALEERVRKLEADNNEIIDNLEQLNETMNVVVSTLKGRPINSTASGAVGTTNSNVVASPTVDSSHHSSSHHSSHRSIEPIVSLTSPDDEVLNQELQRIQTERENDSSTDSNGVSNINGNGENSNNSESNINSNVNNVSNENSSVVCENGVCQIVST